MKVLAIASIMLMSGCGFSYYLTSPSGSTFTPLGVMLTRDGGNHIVYQFENYRGLEDGMYYLDLPPAWSQPNVEIAKAKDGVLEVVPPLEAKWKPLLKKPVNWQSRSVVVTMALPKYALSQDNPPTFGRPLDENSYLVLRTAITMRRRIKGQASLYANMYRYMYRDEVYRFMPQKHRWIRLITCRTSDIWNQLKSTH